jgi:hypothetical protein
MPQSRSALIGLICALLHSAGLALVWAEPGLLTSIVSAQEAHSITGRVMDVSGGVIIGVNVTVTGERGSLRRLVGDERGEFSVAGEYLQQLGEPRSVNVSPRWQR